MELSFFAKTSGTWTNVAAIAAGTAFGLFVGGRLPLPMQKVITQALGLITLFVGLSMAERLNDAQAGTMDGVVLGLITLVLGGLLGEWLQLEKHLETVGDWLKHQFKGKGQFTEGFVAASLLFCIGPMALIGSLNNGLLGNNTLLTLKSTMDGLASIALTSTYGLGVGFSALSVLVYQGGLSLTAAALSQALPDPATAPSVLLVTGVGGVMILGLGLNLLEVASVRVASFLPALLLAPLFYAIAHRLGS